MYGDDRNQRGAQRCPAPGVQRLQRVARFDSAAGRDQAQCREDGAGCDQNGLREAGQIANRQKSRQEDERTRRQQEPGRADLAQHLAAVELPDGDKVGKIEQRNAADKRGEEIAAVDISALRKNLAHMHERRHKEGGEPGSHQGHERHLEMAVVRPSANGYAAKQWDEDHSCAAMAGDAEGGHVAELVQRDHDGQHHGEGQAADRKASQRPEDRDRRERHSDLSQRVLEHSALAVDSGLGPAPELRGRPAQREVAEDEERRPAIGIGLADRHANAVALGLEYECLGKILPEAGVERTVVDVAGRKRPPVDDMAQFGDALDRQAVAAIPVDRQANAVGLAFDRLGGENLARPSGLRAKREHSVPDAPCWRGYGDGATERPHTDRRGDQEKDQAEIDDDERCGDRAGHEACPCFGTC
jgi:hypothetical protein